MKPLPLQGSTRFPLPTKKSKTTPCKVAGQSPACATPATTFDTSGKSAAVIQGADSLRRARIRFASPQLFAGSKALRTSALAPTPDSSPTSPDVRNLPPGDMASGSRLVILPDVTYSAFIHCDHGPVHDPSCADPFADIASTKIKGPRLEPMAKRSRVLRASVARKFKRRLRQRRRNHGNAIAQNSRGPDVNC